MRANGDFRRGSALLVVLGMLSFMVISGMAFSAFMRYQRLPSSFLRRSVTTRQLSKAALAEAIDEVDRAIGDDPHPNRRTVTGTATAGGSNKWMGRVYIGDEIVTDDAGEKKSAYDTLAGLAPEERDTYANLAVHPGNSVATFPLEGLAYIPPALINDVRFYSRRTPTAQWKGFSFDSGRYCYSCVDVSDCFDVNRMFANLPRSSAASRRLSLGYMFETGTDHTGPGSAAAQWDSWLESFRGNDPDDLFSGNEVPLVSVADFNLAFYDKFGSGGCDGIYSPFANFVQGEWSSLFNSDGADAAKMEKRRDEMFVTDGLYPLTRTENETFDLDLAGEQPFPAPLMRDSGSQGLEPLLNFAPVPSAGRGVWQKALCGLSMAALFDYLDEDSVPVSLTIPTVERAPMVCGVQLKIPGLSVGVIRVRNLDEKGKQGEDKEVPGTKRQTKDGYTVTMQRIDDYRLDGTTIAQAVMNARINPVIVFPFLPDGTAEAGDDAGEAWTLDGRLSLFLSTDCVKGGVSGENAFIGTRAGEGDEYLRPADDNAYATAGLLQNSVVAVPIPEQEFSFQKLTQKPNPNSPYENFAVDASTLSVPFGAQQGKAVRTALEASDGAVSSILKVTYRWTRTVKTDPDTGQKEEIDPQDLYEAGSTEVIAEKYAVRAENTLRPIDCDGALSPDYKALAQAQGVAAALAGIRNLALKAAVWLRVRNDDGDTVDLVPACVYDDISLGGAPTSQKSQDCRRCGGFGYPLLKFDCGDAFVCRPAELAKLVAPQTAEPSPKAIVCGDPRWNHAPEDWFALDGADDPITMQNWFDACGCAESGCDGDIFMATSDRGYLQSVYEFAFLPRLSDLSEGEMKDNTIWGSLAEDAKQGTFANNDWELNFATSLADTKHSERIWRTYRPFAQNGQAADDLEGLGIVAGLQGCRVNPYSDSTNVIAAAFADTPFNWRVASTNDTVHERGKKPRYLTAKTAAQFNPKYAWNDYSDVEWRGFAWDDILDFSANFMEDMDRLKGGEDWRDAFDAQAWDYDMSAEKRFSTFWGLELDDATFVTSVDRRFLYGFWHECFAARQQLFLFFVRAEPMMMGGGVSGQAPPQLSSRAVALVWRAPEAPKTSTGTATGDDTGYRPHRSRILFYHQFE